jgi:hypothetical protein
MRRIATALAAAGALAALILPTSASAAFGPAGSFGGSGSGNGQFNHPQGAVATGATVYVADTSNNRVEYFSSAGAFQGVLSGSPASPSDVAVAPDTSILAAGPGKVVRWTLGLPLASWTPPGTSYGVAVDPGGVVYVSDVQTGVIRKYDESGNLLPGTIGSQGTGPGQFLLPLGLATDTSGAVYVADPGNGKIIKYTTTGFQEWAMPTYTIVGSGGTITGRVQPEDVAVDSSGRVIVPDAGSHSNLVAVFGPDGSLQQVFGSPDTDPGSPCPLRSPWGVATSPSGSLYVVSTGENRIRVFNEASAACPAPNFGLGGGVGGGGGAAGSAPGSATAGAHADQSRPKIKLLGFPHHCARKNFSFQIHVTDDVQIKTLELFVNGSRAARQKPGQAEWNVKVRIPVTRVRREIPKGSRVRVTIEVKVRDASGKKADLTKAFQICA